MANDLFRITVDEPNYSGVLETSDDALLKAANLSDLAGSRLWAQRNSSNGQQVYEALEPEDGLLFYKVRRDIADDEGQYVGVGRVGEKRQLSAAQAETLFGTTAAQLAYIVIDFEQISKTIEEIERLLGYGSYPQSSHRVTDDRYSNVDAVLRSLTR